MSSHTFRFTTAIAVVAFLATLGAGSAYAASIFEVARDGQTEIVDGSEPAIVRVGVAVTPQVPAARLRIIDNGFEAKVSLPEVAANVGTVAETLTALGYIIAPEDVVFPQREEPIPSFGRIFILRAPSMVLQHDGETFELKTRAATVGDLLKEQNVALDEDDRVEPEAGAAIQSNMTVRVVRVEIKEEKETEEIAFETETRDDDSRFIGDDAVLTAGSNGEREVTYKITSEDGKEVLRERVNAEILNEPVTKVIAKGTKPYPKQASSGAYVDEINAASAKYGVDGSELMRVMMCESGGNRFAVGANKYFGLFQFSRGMWSESWNDYRNTDIYDANAQINAAAKAWSLGMRGRWGC